MKIPFLDYFKRPKAAPAAVPVPPVPIVTIEKPASERFGKTVLPNVTRFVGVESAGEFPLEPPEGFEGAASGFGFGSPGSLGGTAVAAPARISLGAGGTITTKPARTRDETAVAIAQRKIALRLGDLSAQVPADMLKAGPIDSERAILFEAVEVERGMASGRPAISLRTIYQQAPEVFAREVAEDDTTQIVLPLEKVLEQFARFQVREDQVRDEALPELETPFFQLTKEDGERFGNSAPIPAPSLPTRPSAQAAPVVEVKPAATPIPNAPDASLPATTAHRPIRLPSLPKQSTGPAAEPIPPRPVAPSTTRPSIPLRTDSVPMDPPPRKISPNGMGAPAPERVPASSGPPVPTAPAAPGRPVQDSPPRVTFKVAPSAREPRPPGTSAERPHRPVQIGAAPAAPSGPKVQLPLHKILSGIPPFQLSGPPLDQVPDQLRIEFPFSIIAPQLSLGRIEITPAQLQAALPAEWREKFTIEDPETPIPLPLQEVLQNLPNDTLQIRADQEQVEVTPAFETPFSQKAAEDAARLASAGAATAATPTESSPEDRIAESEPKQSSPEGRTEVEPPTPAASALAANAEPETTDAPLKPSSPGQTPSPGAAAPLRVKFDSNTLDAKAVVAQASKLDGVQACAIVFSDGLSLAGNIPPEYEVDGICAIAPAIVKRLDAQMASAKLGHLSGITLFCSKAAVTFFTHGNICLAALHSGGSELTGESRTKLGHLAEELSRTYAVPA
jgi:predicted regulator of Ras-like GTPase activity (Roadblock/LC7/MglB family)